MHHRGDRVADLKQVDEVIQHSVDEHFWPCNVCVFLQVRVNSVSVQEKSNWTVYEDYDCMLNQTNIDANNNKFYVIQLLQNVNESNEFLVWTRWGRVVSLVCQCDTFV